MIEDFLKAEVSMLRGRFTSINGYVNVHDYVLQRGRRYESVPLTKEELAVVTRFQRMCRMKECYRNAQTLLWESEDTFKVEYVEGVAIGKVPLPIDHAWNTINGKIVDLTWGLTKKVTRKDGTWYLRRTSRVLGTIPGSFEYYGVVIGKEDVNSNMLAHRVFASVLDDYLCGWPVLRGVKHEEGERARKLHPTYKLSED